MLFSYLLVLLAILDYPWLLDESLHSLISTSMVMVFSLCLCFYLCLVSSIFEDMVTFS